MVLYKRKGTQNEFCVYNGGIFMHKLNKLLVAILTLVLLIGCVFTFVACVDGNEDDLGAGYKFTIVNADGEKIAGVRVQLCIDNMCFDPVVSDENGVAFFSADMIEEAAYQVHILAADDGSVKINGVASNYTFDNSSLVTEAKYGEYTLTLVNK